MKKTIEMVLIYGQEFINQLLNYLSPYRHIRYADSNFARDLENQKLVIGYYFFLSGAVIS